MNAVVPLQRPPQVGVSFSDMERLAESIAKSGLFGMKTKDQALSLMAIAQAEGRHPALAARDYDIIQGRSAKKAEAMLRDFLESGGRVEWHTLDDTKADATFSHPSGGSVRITWDMERVKLAGMAGKDMYKKYPRQMLRSRTVSEGVRTVCPAATSGMYVPEEVADFEARPPLEDVTPAPSPIQAAPPRPPFDPVTGEVKPHLIHVGYKTDDKGDYPDWIGFGKDMIAAILSSQSAEDLEAWQRENMGALDGMSAQAKNAYGSVQKAIAKRREEMKAAANGNGELIGEADAASVPLAAQ